MSQAPMEAIGTERQGEIIIPRTLYHGSRKKLEKLTAMQALSEAKESVPKGELLKGIYLTPEYEIALAMGARPEGLTQINDNNGKRTISFENPEAFDPKREIYVYRIDTESIPKENIAKVDDSQFVIVGIESITPNETETRKAEDIFEYFQQI